MANFNFDGTTTHGEEFIPIILAEEALKSLKANLGLTKKCSFDFNSDIREAGDDVKIPYFNDFLVSEKTPGTPLATNTNVDTGVVTVSLEKHFILNPIMEDRAVSSAQIETMMKASTQMAINLAEHIESYVWEKIVTDALVNPIGTGIAAIDEDDIKEIRSGFMEKKCPKIYDRYLFVGVDGYNDILDVDNFTKWENIGNQTAVRDGQVGMAYGINIYEDQCEYQTAGGTIGHGAAFVTPAVAVVNRALPTNTGAGTIQVIATDDDTGLSIRVTKQWNASQIGIEYVMDCLVGAKSIRPEWTFSLNYLL